MNSAALRLSRVPGLFASQAKLYCLSALIAAVLGIAALTVMLHFVLGASAPNAVDPSVLWSSMTAGRKFGSVSGLLFALWTPTLLAARATCKITSAQIVNQELSLAEVLFDMLRFLPAALAYSLVMGLPVMIGATLLLVPGVLVASLFPLVVPTAVNEPGGMFTALRRGVSLARKVFGKALLVAFLCFAALLVVIVLRIIGVDRYLPGSGLALVASRFAVTYVPALLVLVLANIAFTLLYQRALVAENPGVHFATPSQ
ncbi:MAG TPA: hypothetical protein VE133_02385 [Candidatus Sulfotelmatobacter sp.]|nr:hypothetical protein [Candidatus Sulfotelmatobacter sp.]